MTQIIINIDLISNMKNDRKRMILKVSDVKSHLGSQRNSIDSSIMARRNIGYRLSKSSDSLLKLDERLRNFDTFVNQSIEKYWDTEKWLAVQASSISAMKPEGASLLGNLFSDLESSIKDSALSKLLAYGLYDYTHPTYRTPSEYIQQIAELLKQVAIANASSKDPNIVINDKISRSGFVKIVDKNITYYGGDQDWFPRRSQRFGGCAPTAAANIMAYMAMNDPKLANLYGYDLNHMTISDYSKFMDEVYDYVTPREVPLVSDRYDDRKSTLDLPPSLGITSLSKFAEGVEDYAKSKGVNLKAQWDDQKPTFENAVDYIRSAVVQNKPVALLNMFDGVGMQYTDPVNHTTRQTTFEQHWVTITGMMENKRTG